MQHRGLFLSRWLAGRAGEHRTHLRTHSGRTGLRTRSQTQHRHSVLHEVCKWPCYLYIQQTMFFFFFFMYSCTQMYKYAQHLTRAASRSRRTVHKIPESLERDRPGPDQSETTGLCRFMLVCVCVSMFVLRVNTTSVRRERRPFHKMRRRRRKLLRFVCAMQ